MESTSLFPVEVWDKIGKYANTRLMIDYEVKTMNGSIDLPVVIPEKDDNGKTYVPPASQTPWKSQRTSIAYIDLNYRLVMSHKGKTYTLKHIPSCCLFVPTCPHLMPKTVDTPDTEPRLYLTPRERIERIRNEINKKACLSLWHGPNGLASGRTGKSLDYENGEIETRFFGSKGERERLPFPEAKLLEMVDALEAELTKAECTYPPSSLVEGRE